jgi:hypothetical protein
MDTVKVGDIVLCSVDPALNNGSVLAPAIVTRAWSETTVNLRVLSDSSNPPLWCPSATFASSVYDLSGAPYGRLWTWRP